MICPPNDKLEVVESSLLNVVKPEVKRYNDTNSKPTQAEFNFVKLLLRDNCIKGYTLSFPSNNIPNLFSLTCNSPSHCLLCYWAHTNEMHISYKIKII